MIAPLLVLSMLPQAAVNVPENSRGQHLFRACQAVIRTIDDPNAPMSDFAAGSLCVGYIDGFTDGLEMAGRGLCLSGANLGTMARVYVAFMEKNPKLLDVEQSAGLAKSLMDSYPCKTK